MNNYPMPGPGMNGMPNNHFAPQQTPSPNPAPQQPQPSKTALGITALVLGIIAVLTSFIPIVNNLSFLIGLIGFILGIIGLVACVRGTKSGKGIAIAGVVLCALSFVFVLSAQSSFSKAFNKGFNEGFSSTYSRSTGTSSSSMSSSSSASVSASSASAEAEYVVSIDDCMLGTDYQGQNAAVVTFTFVNNSDTDTSFMVATRAQAFQNGVQLDTAIGTGADSSALTKEIKPGATITVQKGYILTDMSPMLVEVEELINFSDDKLAEKTFTFE